MKTTFYLVFIVKKLFSNYKFTSNKKLFKLTASLCFLAFLYLDINQIWNRKSSSLYCFNRLPLYFTCYLLNSIIKELSLCHELRFSYNCIFATVCWRPQIFQTMNSVGSNNLSLNYQWFSPSGCKDKGIRKFDFMAKLNSFFQDVSSIIFLVSLAEYNLTLVEDPTMNR